MYDDQIFDLMKGVWKLKDDTGGNLTYEGGDYVEDGSEGIRKTREI